MEDLEKVIHLIEEVTRRIEAIERRLDFIETPSRYVSVEEKANGALRVMATGDKAKIKAYIKEMNRR